MNEFFRNLKINHKLLLILFSISFVLIIIGIIALQLSFHIYEEQLYHKAAESLILSSEIADMKFNEIDKISFDILSDKEVQQYLNTIRAQDTLYNWYEALNKLNKKMLQWAFSENYISSIIIMDSQGKQVAWGKTSTKISQERIEFIYNRAIEKEGRPVWIEPDSPGSSIIAARTIRSIPDLELENIGVLIIQMDPEILFDNSSGQRMMSKYNSNLAIISENSLVYQRCDQLDSNKLISKMNKETGYFIRENGNYESNIKETLKYFFVSRYCVANRAFYVISCIMASS